MDEVIASDSALAEIRVVGSTACRNHDRRQALCVQIVGMVEARSQNRRRMANVLGCAEDHNGVRGMQLLKARLAHDFEAGGTEKEDEGKEAECDQGQKPEPSCRFSAHALP